MDLVKYLNCSKKQELPDQSNNGGELKKWGQGSFNNSSEFSSIDLCHDSFQLYWECWKASSARQIEGKSWIKNS